MQPVTVPRVASALIGALGLLVAPTPANSQTVWRCGGSSYEQAPCAGGHAVDVSDARSAEQVRMAIEVAARERRLADAMTAERRLREKLPSAVVRHRRVKPIARVNRGANQRPKPCPRKSCPPASADTWRAIAPATRQTKD
jgi:hypothetical protein